MACSGCAPRREWIKKWGGLHMREQKGSLMFLATHKTLTRKQRAALESAQPSERAALAESMGIRVVTREEGMGAGIHSDIRPRERMESMLVVKVSEKLTREQMERIRICTSPLAEKMGMQLAICGEGMDIGIASDLAPTLKLLLEEQRQTNQLLLMLIEAMGEEDADPDDEPVTYMDGSLV